MEATDILFKNEQTEICVNYVQFIEFSQIITSNWTNPQEWMEAQSKLFRVKRRMEEDYFVLDPVNPYLIIIDWDPSHLENNEVHEAIFQQENLIPVLQVWTWMLIEYYNEHPHTQSAEIKSNLFQGVITMINAKNSELIDTNRLLLRDIWKLAGRLSRISWEESNIYQDAISLLTNSLYNENKLGFRSALMIYFSELISEMQSREPKMMNNEKNSFVLSQITDIFIVAYQNFNYFRKL